MNTRIKQLVDTLVESYEEHPEIIKIDSGIRLNRDHIIDILEKLRRLIFPGYFGKIISSGSAEYYAGDILEDVSRLLSTEIAQAISPALRHGGDSPRGEIPEENAAANDPVEVKAGELTFQFLAGIPGIR